ncbi:MAG TPA: maltotransferase domain-containing protein [Planctomycetota bacterium]|nr:maltotransferase domain-containing protein [Planctomycetota bacterium]
MTAQSTTGRPRSQAPAAPAAALAGGRIFIERVSPTVDGGRYPAKRIAGEACVVEADLVRDGHDRIRAAVRWKRKHADEPWREAPLEPLLNDRWQGEFPLAENARYVFRVEAWTDPFATWAAAVGKKIAAKQDVASEVLEGLAILERMRPRATAPEDAARLDGFSRALAASAPMPRVVQAILDEPDLRDLVGRLSPRGDLSASPTFEVVADRPLARFSAWYELFPRSCSPEPGRHGTLRDAERRLHEIRDLGFDVVYLPPIHPIGHAHRKGKNNALRAEPGDPGSPWAIGSEAGGHDAIEPALGTIEDFDRFVGVAERLGLEVALDFAIQCSPDHPWVREHPEWFYRRADGTIKYAENPPKKYEDVYPVNFDTEDRAGLWAALRRVVEFWIAHGVRVFRVDNPHTKPLAFWEWLIGEIQAARPDVIFLAEAFTRPKLMYALAKLGFTQSYTYFTWRNRKWELTQYLEELTRTEAADFFRPNFFANTPDILPEYLQEGGRPAFKIRLVLAATLSPAYGIYSGYELCENVPVAPGKEEYLHSEKYELKQRDWSAAGNINDFIQRVNAIRRENPALALHTNLRFLPADRDEIIFYAKATPDRSNAILVAVNLDPRGAQECTVRVPLEELGIPAGARFEVRDLLTGETFVWGEWNYVRLDPERRPAHILRVERRLA